MRQAPGTVGSIAGYPSSALIVPSILAILRVFRGQDAGLPLIRKITEGNFMASLQRKPNPRPCLISNMSRRHHCRLPEAALVQMHHPNAASAPARPHRNRGSRRTRVYCPAVSRAPAPCRKHSDSAPGLGRR